MAGQGRARPTERTLKCLARPVIVRLNTRSNVAAIPEVMGESNSDLEPLQVTGDLDFRSEAL